MVTQFERSHCVVGNHTIILTSWFDEVREVWQTSAPNYMHLSIVANAAHVSSTSRKAALTHLSETLTRCLAPAGQPLASTQASVVAAPR
jgi:hypothetical protein